MHCYKAETQIGLKYRNVSDQNLMFIFRITQVCILCFDTWVDCLYSHLQGPSASGNTAALTVVLLVVSRLMRARQTHDKTINDKFNQTLERYDAFDLIIKSRRWSEDKNAIVDVTDNTSHNYTWWRHISRQSPWHWMSYITNQLYDLPKCCCPLRIGPTDFNFVLRMDWIKNDSSKAEHQTVGPRIVP